MATSGQHTGSVATGYAPAKVYCVLVWQRTSYSITDNTTSISWTLSIKNDGIPVLGDTLGGGSTYKVVFDGQVAEGTVDAGIAVNNTKQLASGSFTIPHNANGTKTFTITASVDCTWGVGNTSINTTATFDTIPRPVVIDSAPNFTSDDNPTITFRTPSRIYGTVATCISLTGAKDDVPYRNIPNPTNPGTYTFNLTTEEQQTLWNAVKTGSSITVYFYIRNTIDGVHYRNSLAKTYTLTEFLPLLAPTIVDTNATTLALTGNSSRIVKGYSDVDITFNATGRRGATITKKTLVAGNQSFTINTDSQDKVAIEDIKTDVFNFGVEDSRGNTTKQTIELGDKYIPYFGVSCNQTVKLNADGSAALIVKGTYFNGSFGAKNNTLKIETRRRENGGEWSSWADITPLLTEINDDNYLLSGTISGYDVSGTYDFQCRAVDSLTIANSTVETISLKPIFDWSNFDFNFNVPITIQENPLDDFVIETGTEAMGTNGTWYWRKWKNGRAECYGCRNYGTMSVSTAWGNLYRSSGIYTQTLPTDLFVSAPEVIDITLRSGSYGGWIVCHENSAPDASKTGSFIVVRPASATITQPYISFNVIGRWK